MCTFTGDLAGVGVGVVEVDLRTGWRGKLSSTDRNVRWISPRRRYPAATSAGKIDKRLDGGGVVGAGGARYHA